MNSLTAGFYLPVFVTDDSSKKLFFLSPNHETSIKSAYACFDELKKITSAYKVSSFMTSKDIEISPEYLSEIRAIKSVPRNEEHFSNQGSYDKWLEDKVILRTERFFPGRPVWNIASTRHALLSNYQYKGIGFTGISGRCDYPHISGYLDIYLALYETVMSWHFSNKPIKTQKVVCLWKDEHLTNPKILMLREANSFRLAQIIGINLELSEKKIILRSLEVSEENGLREKFYSVIKNYAWFVAHSYEYTSPTFDNLMLDGSLIDCSSILHYNGNGWVVPFHVIKGPDGLWGAYYTFQNEVLTFLTYTLRAYQNLGLDLDINTCQDYFWTELCKISGKSTLKVRTFFDSHKEWKNQKIEEWEGLFKRSFPEAQVTSIHPEQSKFHKKDIEENKRTFLITFPDGPKINFSPYQVTDRIFQFLNSNRDISPVNFAEAVIRSADS